MGDLNTTGALTRRRRATLAAERGVGLQPVNGSSAAAPAGSMTAGFSAGDGLRKRDRSLERPRKQGERKTRKSEISDSLR